MFKNRAKKALKSTARRARTKTKKPKYLSLRHQLSSQKTTQNQSPHDQQMLTSASNHHQHRQLNLFPLHPENTDNHEHENMAYFFSSADGGDTTLTGLLSSSTTSSSDHEDNVTGNCTTLSSSVSLSYPYGSRDGGEEVALVRTALRNKERDASEERWVCYSEVVERRPDEEVTSCAVDDRRIKLQRLDLKLDYQEIMNAWSDRGSLFIHAEFPQTVPDIYDDFLPHQTSHGLQDPWGRNVGVWRVPEMKNKGVIRSEKEGQECEDQLKFGQREASVLRYKEKRQNRLFAKRIRYEVRKLNAEKRPRVKGRFVKRS